MHVWLLEHDAKNCNCSPNRVSHPFPFPSRNRDPKKYIRRTITGRKKSVHTSKMEWNTELRKKLQDSAVDFKARDISAHNARTRAHPCTQAPLHPRSKRTQSTQAPTHAHRIVNPQVPSTSAAATSRAWTFKIGTYRKSSTTRHRHDTQHITRNSRTRT